MKKAKEVEDPMAQIGNVHPDKLLPWWHAARQLTPEEIEIVGRIACTALPKRIEQAEHDMAYRLEDLPPIPPRRADRHAWSRALDSDQSMRMWNYDGEVKEVAAIREALAQRDPRRLLRLMTRSRPLTADELKHDLRPAWQRQLQEIRDALEKRIDDALERAVQAKAAEEIA